METRIVIVGAGPAGFAVASALLAAVPGTTIDLVDRDPLPDGLLRHGPAAGEQRLRAVAHEVDAVLADDRLTYIGGIDVGTDVSLDELRSAADAVVLTTGAPQDLPLTVAGRDAVGIGTITHVRAWLAGSADVAADELDLAMDTAVLLGASAEAIDIAQMLCGHIPAGVSAEARKRLSGSTLRRIQLVDQRSEAEMNLPSDVPADLIVRSGLTPVGVVGRNRARALRCLHRPDAYDRVVSEDLRAQLLLRPRSESFCWPGVDENEGHIAHHHGRVLRAGTRVPGLYVAGWAGRAVPDTGSHASDAAAVVAAIEADCDGLMRPEYALSELLADRGVAVSGLDGWSASAATHALLGRFAGEGTAPLADYDELLEHADDD
ncbi:FAD-dependent oxidoreductase [[Mycobacterium] vasticus]|uniref:ferredoxin--NADP(+) reductase n=1 Tax=[Mycobacterium] vasticus TaxID=2875777 RepID=A0ABU5Z252_9MYCO|nr:FAD-dependent oxidoreductase [Mycolicibacter sp. MYC017]MEB3071485.1 FAD-dependent oxidoreductase [Mycolicibacter sp. MYC017]